MKLLTILSVLLCLNLTTLMARETDQYMTWQIELPDSSPLVNQYFSEEMQSVLENKANAHKSCQDLTLKFYKKLVGTFTFSKLSLWAQDGSEMEPYRFPSKEVSKLQYAKASIFGGSGASPIIKWIIGLAPSININGIYLGTDKLGHISYMGYKYYRKYLKLIKKGMTHPEAMHKVLLEGLKSETMLGGFYGTSSPSDLEANYQGLKLAIDLCEGPDPILSKNENDMWSVDKSRFKIENYVTPEFDESFYPIIFGKLTWKKSAEERIQKICAEKDLSLVKKRFADYRQRFSPSINIAIISAKMQADAKFSNAKFNYQTACGLDF